MTGKQFRWLVVAFAVVYAWWWSLPFSPYMQDETLRAAMEHSGKGGILAPNDTLAYAFLAATLVAAAGLFFHQSWARHLLLLTTIVSVILGALAGIAVSGPFDGTLGYLASVLTGAVLAASWKTRRAAAPAEESVTVYESADPSTLPVVQSLLHDAGIASAAKLTVRQSDAIVAKDVLELGN